MPSFELEFEVFCGICGAGLCNQSNTRTSRNRSMPQVTVDVCKDCLSNATEPLVSEIDDLKSQVQQLEELLEHRRHSYMD